MRGTVAGRVRTVSPAWFRSHVLPAEQDTWDQLESDLLADQDERLRVTELCSDLAESGFEHPVTVGRDKWWNRRPRVRDGIHRSVAAMRLGIDIPIRFGEPEMEGYDEQDKYIVTVSDVSGDSDELFERVYSLASFRSGDGFWMRCDVATGGRTPGVVNLFMPRRESRRAVIAGEIVERLRGSGIPAEVSFAGED
jgi:hypothetical protein